MAITQAQGRTKKCRLGLGHGGSRAKPSAMTPETDHRRPTVGDEASERDIGTINHEATRWARPRNIRTPYSTANRIASHTAGNSCFFRDTIPGAENSFTPVRLNGSLQSKDSTPTASKTLTCCLMSVTKMAQSP